MPKRLEMPEWIQIEELSWRETLEVNLYKTISMVPVSVTFGLYVYLFVFYSYVSPIQGNRLVLLVPHHFGRLLQDWVRRRVGERGSYSRTGKQGQVPCASIFVRSGQPVAFNCAHDNDQPREHPR